jgi:hypothetical protein
VPCAFVRGQVLAQIVAGRTVAISRFVCRSGYGSRFVAVIPLLLLLCAPAARGQSASSVYPYGLDPYKPTDAWWLRQYGSVLVAQTPILELRKLDPFKPSEAALLRDLGGGIPLWALWYPPAPMPVPLTPFSMAGDERAFGAATNIFINIGQPSDGNAVGSAAPVSAPSPPPGGIVTALRPESNDGVWINYGGRRWVSAGPAVPFDDSVFMQTGQYNGFPVFTRRQSSDPVIYLPTRGNLVAPYRVR